MKRIILSLIAIAMFGLMAQANAATTVYTNKSDWEAAVGSYSTEDFGDDVMNTGVSVVSDVGSIQAGVWEDAVTPDGRSTTFSFSTGIFGFGGEWGLDAPGGSTGTGIAVTLTLLSGGTELLATEIPNTLDGTFWGFVTNVAFTEVILTSGTQEGEGDGEAFYLDNMVYSDASASAVPVPAAVWLFGSGLLGLMGVRHRRA